MICGWDDCLRTIFEQHHIDHHATEWKSIETLFRVSLAIVNYTIFLSEYRHSKYLVSKYKESCRLWVCVKSVYVLCFYSLSSNSFVYPHSTGYCSGNSCIPSNFYAYVAKQVCRVVFQNIYINTTFVVFKIIINFLQSLLRSFQFLCRLLNREWFDFLVRIYRLKSYHDISTISLLILLLF